MPRYAQHQQNDQNASPIGSAPNGIPQWYPNGIPMVNSIFTSGAQQKQPRIMNHLVGPDSCFSDESGIQPSDESAGDTDNPFWKVANAKPG